MLGPVFERELATTARSARAFALRSTYDLVLLAVVVATYRDTCGTDLDLDSMQVTSFAEGLFRNLVYTQAVAVVLLTPALVAGAIAGEAQRKTLDDLLMTALTGAEIVLGKLAAGLLHLGVLVAAGLPILLLAGMLGGVDLRLMILSLAGTITLAFFLGGLSILASTQARTVRGAMNLVFTLVLTWLILPTAVDFHLPRSGSAGRQVHEWVAPVNAWIAPASPFSLLLEFQAGSLLGDEVLVQRVLGMAGLQVLYGAALTGLAVVRLRTVLPHAAGREAAESVAVPEAGVPCGDDPMIWKELCVASAPSSHRHLGLSVALVLGGVLVWGTIDLALPAFRELLASGYGVGPSGSARGLFHLYLRIVATGVALAVLLGIASDAAAGMTTERERDTWISLITAPLTGREIVRAKLLGAVWGIRHVVVVAALLAFAGVLAGSLHPIALALVVVELMTYSAFVAALGTWVSLRAGDTLRAVAATLGCLLYLGEGVGPLLVMAALWSVRPLALTGCAPAMLALSMASPGELQGRSETNSLGGITDARIVAMWAGYGTEVWIACLASVAGYSIAAWTLWRSACRGFDAQLDRPALLAVPRIAPTRRKRWPVTREIPSGSSGSCARRG